MTMPPLLRKFALTAHVTSSVGWLGAVVCFLALAVAGLTSQDTQKVRAAYLAMELTAWFVIVPLSLASPITGLVQSLGTTWGLFRHYWVLVKLVITIPATILLLVHMRPIGHLARVVADTTLSSGDHAGLRIQLIAQAGAASVVLIGATILSVYKPWGLTTFGRRQQQRSDSTDNATTFARKSTTNRWKYAIGIFVIVLVVLFVLLHLIGGGLGGHT